MIVVLRLAFALQGAIPTWSVSPTPTLTVEDDGTPATEFVRIMGVTRLPGGGVALAEESTNNIRIFDSRAKHVTSLGRTGEGPGEFRRLELIGRSADTAWYFDSRLQRITTVLFGAKPELSRSIRVTATGGQRFDVTGRLADGRWVVATPMSPTFDGPPGVHRVPGSIGIIAATGDGEVGWLGEFKSAAIFVHSPTGDIKNAAVGPIAFSPWLRSAASGGQVWIGDSAGDSLVVVRARDRSRFIVRLPIARRAPDRALVDAARAREMGSNRSPTGSSFTEAKHSAKYLPERLPYFELLVPGPRGEVWVQAYTGNRSSAAQYVVIDSTGRPRGRVSVPAGDRIREAGLDYVILVHQDQDGVESVRVHRLERR